MCKINAVFFLTVIKLLGHIPCFQTRGSLYLSFSPSFLFLLLLHIHLLKYILCLFIENFTPLWSYTPCSFSHIHLSGASCLCLLLLCACDVEVGYLIIFLIVSPKLFFKYYLFIMADTI